MKAIVPVLLAAGFAAVTSSAFGVELTADERTELRARAERLQTERAQSPLRAADTVPLDRPQGDMRFRDSGDVKPGKRSAEVKPHKSRGLKAKTTDRKKSKRAKRSLRDIPGAFVRR